MPHMMILRGGPGSGKSWYAAQRCFTIGVIPTVCSADEFFINDVGEYDFDPKWLGRAHGACLKKCVEAMASRLKVIIDNTNSKPEEMIPYLALCQAFSYSCKVITIHCDREIAWARQLHDLPRDKFDSIFTTVEQSQVPKLYRNAPWLTISELRPDRNFPKEEALGRPDMAADCSRCQGVIAFWKHMRVSAAPMDTCVCEIPMPTNHRPCCDCGVSMGLRSDHEAECAMAYPRRKS